MIPITKGTGGGGDVVNVVAESTATLTVDLADGNVHDITLSASCTLSFDGVAPTGRRSVVMLVLRQDSVGSRTATWPGAVLWPGGTAPTLSTAADAVDVFELATLDGGTSWLGVEVGLAYS